MQKTRLFQTLVDKKVTIIDLLQNFAISFEVGDIL